jgi:transcriptional regulator with XRE-family HTH domain
MRTLEARPRLFYPGEVKKKAPPLNFPQHLAAPRKERGLVQQALAERVGMHISQIRRYESGQSQPTLDAIRKLARALRVSADMLLFEKDERGPDEDLKLQFEAVSRLDPEEKKVIRSVIESIILRHEARIPFKNSNSKPLARMRHKSSTGSLINYREAKSQTR